MAQISGEVNNGHDDDGDDDVIGSNTADDHDDILRSETCWNKKKTLWPIRPEMMRPNPFLLILSLSGKDNR